MLNYVIIAIAAVLANIIGIYIGSLIYKHKRKKDEKNIT